MGDLLIRDVDDYVIRNLEARAETNGTSLQHEARMALQQGAAATPQEKQAIFEELDRLWGDNPRPTVSAADLLREMREEE